MSRFATTTSDVAAAAFAAIGISRRRLQDFFGFWMPRRFFATEMRVRASTIFWVVNLVLQSRFLAAGVLCVRARAP